MNEATLNLITDLALPSVAIIISTLVAVSIARWERKAAAAARRDERIDQAFVRVLVALATLNTINMRVETVAEPLRELRVGLSLLVDADVSQHQELVGEWFEAERLAGAAQSRVVMRNLETVPKNPYTEAEIERVVQAGGPINSWARDFASNLRVWRRSGATKEQLLQLTEGAKLMREKAIGEVNGG